MAVSSSRLLTSYRSELQSIISALAEVEEQLRADAQNIGNERCADSIRSVITKYEKVATRLASIKM